MKLEKLTLCMFCAEKDGLTLTTGTSSLALKGWQYCAAGQSADSGHSCKFCSVLCCCQVNCYVTDQQREVLLN